MKRRIPFLLMMLFVQFPIIAQWTSQTLSTTQDLESVVFLNSTTGVAAGNFTSIFRTTDGGVTWNATGYSFAKSISFSDNLNGYSVSFAGSGSVKKTSDGGVTWVNKTPPNGNSMWTVFSNASNTLYFSDASNKLFKSTTSGSSYSSQIIPNSASYSIIMSIFFTDASTGYLTDQDGIVWKTTNSGANWSNVYTAPGVNGNGVWLTSIHFPSPSIGYTCGTGGDIHKTIDAGVTWNLQKVVDGVSFNGIRFFNDTVGLAVGYNGAIYYTKDGGVNWNCHDAGITEELFSVSFLSLNVAVIVGAKGKVLKNSTLFTTPVGTCITTGIDEQKDKVEIQTYPNPASDMVKIENKTGRHLTCQVINKEGIIVKEMDVNSEGLISVDVHELPSGLYFLKTICDSKVYTQKITIMNSY